jgi:peroxiredoxin
LQIAIDGAGNVSGTLSGDGWQLDLAGTCRTGDPPVIRFQGKGAIEGELWVYDYIGFAVPKWPNGIAQRPAIVGTIVRTAPHSNGSGGTSPAGVVAQWIAVRQDADGGLTKERNGPGPGPAAEELVRQLETSWADAVETNDADQIAPFFGKDFVFVGPSGVLQSREQHLDDFRTKKLTVDSVAIQRISTDVYDAVAVANVTASVKGAYDGRDITGDYSFKDTWRLTEGRWLAFARKQKKIDQRSRSMGDATPDRPATPVRRERYSEPERENSQDRARFVPPSSASDPTGSLPPEMMRSFNDPLDLASGTQYQTVQKDQADALIPIEPGTPSVLLFVKGSFCPYCMSQVATMSERLADRNVNVYVVSSSSEDDLKAFPKTPFHLIADPELRFYKTYGVFNGEPRHATIVLNAEGREVFRNVDDEPMIDTMPVIQAIESSRILSARASN